MKLKATLPFNYGVAKKLMNVAYYRSYSRNMKEYVKIEKEKRRRATKRWAFVTKILDHYKTLGYDGPRSSAGKALHGIYNNNIAYAKGYKPFRKTTNLVKVVAKPEMLLLAYKRIKRNRGALTPAEDVDSHTFNNYTPQQKDVFFRKKTRPDGFSLEDIYLTSVLIRKGKYPWGSSRRIWLDKPGSDKKRPITIPPFMDRIVQESIKMVLVAIWEPDFETMNRSFGFRPNKSCHDALAALQSNHTIGLRNALEGDVSAAYDNVRKEDAIRCLKKKIQDNKFMRLMSKRWDYDYVDMDTGERVRPSMGIPQGGIDSPYIFNIVFHELDLFIQNNIQQYLDDTNKKMGFTKGKERLPKNAHRWTLYNRCHRAEQRIATLAERNFELNKSEIFTLARKVRFFKIELLKRPWYDPKKRFRLFYVRYADDWILLTNANEEVLVKIKGMIKDFLFDSLGAKLSDEKTLITDTRKKAAHFLGFEICSHSKSKLIKTEKGLTRVSTFPLIFRPDRTRIINKFHSKGFCDKKGFPKSIPWLSNLETTVIMERFNASIRGLATYYTEWITRPTDLHRWIYILRFSCLKTVAQKYKSTINKVFIRFGTDRYSAATKTITAQAKITVGSLTYVREWKLDTYIEVVKKNKLSRRRQLLYKVFNERESGKIGEYPLKKDRPTVTHENFVDYITWVSLRTQAPFAMPCCICGSMEQIEMHHIRHIRKKAFSDLKEANFLKMMSLRNRKQIPVCRHCHMHVIHSGDYKGGRLEDKVRVNRNLVDNRIIHIESYVKPGKEYFSKTLPERGWKLDISNLLK